MVDRVYKSDILRLKKELEALKREFAAAGGTTDWVGLRIDPLIRHADSLDQTLNSEGHSKEFARLKRGVDMFHSDLVYLRMNVKSLRKLLVSGKSRIRSGTA